MNLPFVFNAYQATRYAGITTRQLRYWDEIGLVRPSVQATNGVSGKPRKYSREDVLKLKAVKVALDEGRTLQEIRGYHGQPVVRDAVRPRRTGIEEELARARAVETWRRQEFDPTLLYRTPEGSGRPMFVPASEKSERSEARIVATAPESLAKPVSVSSTQDGASGLPLLAEDLSEAERRRYRSGSWL